MLSDYLVLLRPKGFVPALLFVTTGYLVSPSRQVGVALALDLAFLFVAYVVCLSGGTLMLNSAVDRDAGPVTFLEAPPPPPRALGLVGVVVMAVGVVLFGLRGGLVSSVLAGALFVMSIGYSHGFGRRRWKEIPVVDALVNGVGYGAVSAALGFSITGAAPTSALLAACVAFSVSVTATFPATQLYQLPADFTLAHERNLASLLGGRGSLTWTALLLTVAIAPVAIHHVARGSTSVRAQVGFAVFVILFVMAIVRTIVWRVAPFVRPYAQLQTVIKAVLAARIAWIVAAAP